MTLFLWLLYFIPALAVEIFCWFTNWFPALFSVREERHDRVKRIDKVNWITMEHEYLPKWCRWYQTHDNAVDEYWWGMYNEGHWLPYIKNMTQEQYDNSWLARYVMRVCWLYRNNAYGFLYNIFSKPDRRGDSYREYKHGEEHITRFWFVLRRYEKSGFQLEGHFPIMPVVFGRNIYNDLNIGWKDHRSAVRCLYANRIIGLRVEKL